MKLTELTGQATATDPEIADPEVLGLAVDSRRVQPGFLFAALRGAARDGRAFAGEAAQKGAVAILTDDPAALALDPGAGRRIAIIADANPQLRLALFAARFYRRQPRTIAAVTGTNGKTSVAHFTREIWTLLGYPAADRKSTRLNSSHIQKSRMPSSA